MKSVLILLLFLSTGLISFSQDYENEVPYTFEVSKSYFLLADSVNIRQTPDINGKFVTQLPIGTQVKIISQSAVITRLNNFNMYWYEIQFSGKKKGYVWGGKIAKTSVRSTKDYDLIFHFGLDHVSFKEDWVESYYQIRIEKAGKQLAKHTYEGFGYSMKVHTLTNHGDRGLKSVDDVLYIDGFSEACGDEGGAIVLFYSGGKLQVAKRLSHFVDVPVFSNDALYFPADMEGRREQVVFYHESGEWVEDENDPSAPGYTRYDDQKSVFYKWDGTKLIEVKK